LTDESPDGNVDYTYEVVGVARDFHSSGLRGKVGPRMFFPFTQPEGDVVKRANFLIRAAGPASPVLAAVRREFRQVDASLPINFTSSIDELIAQFTAVDRATAQVSIAFGCIALILAAIGLYGVLSYAVASRRREIAIRIALGARPGSVVNMVLRETGLLFAAGVVIGGGLTYWASRWIASLLFGVAPQDPVTAAAAILLLTAVAFSAVYLPARRASRVDPMNALRQE